MSSERELSGSSPGRVNVCERNGRSKEEEKKEREGAYHENQGFIVLLQL
jgi:hypothetical protein